MEPDKNNSPAPEDTPKEEQSSAEATPAENQDQQAPADALSLTPEEIEQEVKESTPAGEAVPTGEPDEKKVSPFKKFLRKVNIYFLIFALLLVVAGVIAVVTYFNSQQPAAEPNVANQQLTSDALKQLANTDATVGNTSQTLTIQGNAIIAGQTLTRGNLNVAGNLQTGGSTTTPNLTVSGSANLGTAQANSLQVAANTAIQGTTTLRDLNVSGTTSFSGPVTASQITVTRLILSGNAVLQVPNHISFTGSTPNRSVNSGVLGAGGTLSLNGSDVSGTININTGAGTTPGCFAKITFQQTYTNPPHVIVSPVGSAAAQTQYYVDRNTTSFSLCTVNAAPTNQTFAFDYFITN